VRRLEAADALRDRSRERSSFMAEKLAFEQFRRDGRAVHLHEGALAPVAVHVDGARDEFLAGTGFAFNQDRRVGWGHHPNMTQNGAQGRA
jgi:hypothetical protein